MKNILIIGYGEIGRAMHALYSKEYDVGYIDKLEITYVPETIDVMHICIPFDEEFVDIVCNYIDTYKPKLVIVNSTVQIGTTRAIYDRTKVNVVQSPVMGRHPNLSESIKTFTKIVGGCTKEASDMAFEHFNELNVQVKIYKSSEDAEAAKLFDTTYLGWNVIYMKQVHKFCEEHGLSFDEVYTTTNEIYNQGYTDMDEPQFTRPILKYMGHGISGHCTIQNAIILHKAGMLEDVSKIVLSDGFAPKYCSTKPLYEDETWLYCEYYGKDKSCSKIGEEQGVSDVTIGKWLKKFNIPVKKRQWTEEEDDLLKEMSQELTFKEIADKGIINRTYDQIRNRAYSEELQLESVYDPSNRDLETRKKISCTLRDIPLEEFDKFMWKESPRIRRKEYYEWRKAVLEKYDYTCQKTKIKGGKLNVHHIEPWNINESLRYDINNGVVLLEKWHLDFHKKYGFKNCTKEQLKEYLESEPKK
jgi:hypothetical protein